MALVLVQSMDMLFSYYDRSGDGRIDYKEFANIFIDSGKTDADMK